MSRLCCFDYKFMHNFVRPLPLHRLHQNVPSTVTLPASGSNIPQTRKTTSAVVSETQHQSPGLLHLGYFLWIQATDVDNSAVSVAAALASGESGGTQSARSRRRGGLYRHLSIIFNREDQYGKELPICARWSVNNLITRRANDYETLPGLWRLRRFLPVQQGTMEVW